MFYETGVDISNTKSMWNFLKNHFTYYTQNSWNGTYSFANNVKIYQLHLTGDDDVALVMLEDRDGYEYISEELDFFAERHLNARVYFNGRSGGYLVLTTERGGSVVPDCVDEYDTYEDFKKDNIVNDFKDELRIVTQLVQDFDKLCDSLRDYVDALSHTDLISEFLEAGATDFNYLYEDDMETLGIKPLEVVDGKVDVTEVFDTNLRVLVNALYKTFKNGNQCIVRIEPAERTPGVRNILTLER